MEDGVANSLATTNLGDRVWVKALYGTAGTPKWQLWTVTGETRSSFLAGGYAFDRKTGVQRNTRGFAASFHIYGESERADRLWLDNAYLIGRRVEQSDLETLKRVAAIIDFEPKNLPAGV